MTSDVRMNLVIVMVILLIAVLVVISILTGFIVKHSNRQTNQSTVVQSTQSDTTRSGNGVDEKLERIENKIDRINKLTSAGGLYNIGLTAMVAGLTFFLATFTLASQGIDFSFVQFAGTVWGGLFIAGVVISIIGIARIFKARRASS